MNGFRGCITIISIILISTQIGVIVGGDSVLSVDDNEVLEAGSFEDSSLWSISSTSGFSQNSAQYSMGMVADEELSFTHDRPGNFDEIISWSSSSPTSSNYSTGNPDGYYTWSRGPNITLEGFEFDGMSSLVLANISLVIHFEIPDVLYSDTVRIILGGVGSEKLVKTYTRTLSGVYKMNNPLVIPLDDQAQWTWQLAEGAYITIDYVSQGGGSDDSEVRVDAVGIKARYLQPWYSFENVKATHELNGHGMPVLDFGPYDGDINGLVAESCGLTNDGGSPGIWEFTVTAPYGQELGRIHIFGDGNFTIEAMPEGQTSMENWETYGNGDLLDQRDVTNSIRLTIYDGCISLARVDVNDPQLVVSGTISGDVTGLSQAGSSIKFALGSFLINSVPINLGEFEFSLPIGHALPTESSSAEFGIASRFQWASDGSPETVVVHIDSASISGGYTIEWDRDPECISMNDIDLEEDGGSVLIPLSVTCTDDITDPSNLVVEATSSAQEIVYVYSEGSSLVIQPMPESFGESTVSVVIIDEGGNEWRDSFKVDVSEIEDPPRLEGLPMSVYVEIGESAELEIKIIDPDTENLMISTSRSWAVYSEGILTMSPVETGVHSVEIVVSDGNSQYSQMIDVVVTSKPDLVVETISVSNPDTGGSGLRDGEVGTILSYVRNEGMGDAGGVEVRCYLDDALVGTSTIPLVTPGGLEEVQCDAVFQGPGIQLVRVEVDNSGSILETDEGNNVKELEVTVGTNSQSPSEEDESNRNAIILASSIGVMMICLAFLRVGPGRVKKPYNRSRK
ncbi:MAG: CARDB domain-containing protein [Candidatus Thermoplasmatota archaeon]|nr:CARDB domain-containing protein [Candidatus Thermoplasmatota archaeon]